MLNETYLFEKKDSDKMKKNGGNQRNYRYKLEKRLEKEIKNKKLKKWVRLVKNYENKNTQTNKLIILTMSKETNLFEISFLS